MMMKITMSLAALALGGGLTLGPAFAQHTGARSSNDNGVPATEQSGQSTQPSPSNGPFEQSRGIYNEAPGMSAPGDESEVASCEARFRSYDPASGTYLGLDGMRHPCP
jgi:hypothetical protein